jgi:hypothetical protein
MRSIRKTLFLLCAVAGLHAMAQESKGYLGIGFHTACPQSELKDIKYDNGYGINLSYLSSRYPSKSMLNVQAGMQMDFAKMQSKKFENLELSDPNIIGTATITATNSMYATMGVVRLNWGTDDDKFVPYVNFLIGNRQYNTRQRLQLDEVSQNPDYQSDTTTRHIVYTSRLHYGAGIGCSYRLNKSFSLESGITYTFGDKGAALPLRNIKQVEGTSQVDFSDYKIVKTDMLLINVGFRIHLFQQYQTPLESTSSPTTAPTTTRYKDVNTPRTSTPTPRTNTPRTTTPSTRNSGSTKSSSPKKTPISTKGAGAVKGGGKG